jgi:YggT family protein
MSLFVIVHIVFVLYTILLLLRVLSSWLPYHVQHHQVVRFIAFYTDPYLHLFRRVLPPLGGILDLSPILAFFVLKLLEMVVLSILRLLLSG